jgi:hypothetical protein
MNRILISNLLLFLLCACSSSVSVENLDIHTEKDLERLANQLTGGSAVKCGSLNSGPFGARYPFSGDQCAVKAYREGKPFQVHSCYSRTDTAGCYWIVGTPTNEIYFFLYTYYAWGNTLGPPYSCFSCKKPSPVIQQCKEPAIVTKRGIETIQ